MAQKGFIKNSGTNQLGAPEFAAIFQGLLGGSGILDIFSDLALSIVSDTSVSMAAGVYNLSGYLLGVEKGTTVTFAISAGTAGQNRNDLIIAEFIRDGGGAGIDTLQFRVAPGTPTSGTAADPYLTQEDINGSGTTRRESVWRVKLAGTTLTAVEQVALTLGQNTPVMGPFQSDNSAYVPKVYTNGEINIGKYLDFHEPDSTNDYDGRIYCDAANDLLFKSPDNPAAARIYTENAVKFDSGYIDITPVANTITEGAIVFNAAFTVPPIVMVCQQSAYPGTLDGLTVSGSTVDGATVYVLRSDTTSTRVNWRAEGP